LGFLAQFFFIFDVRDASGDAEDVDVDEAHEGDY
jgi:hypothetical protein